MSKRKSAYFLFGSVQYQLFGLLRVILLSLSQKTVQLFVLGQLGKKLGGRVSVQLFLYMYDSGSQLAFAGIDLRPLKDGSK